MPHNFKNDRLKAIYDRRLRPHRSDEPIENLWATSWIGRYRFFKYIDVYLYCGVCILLILAFILFIFKVSGDKEKMAAAAAVVAAILELLRRLYETIIKRMSTYESFSSEIISIVRSFSSGNIVGQFIRLYDVIDQEAAKTADGITGEHHIASSAFARPAGKENYFNVFEKNCSDLGVLPAKAVNDIVAFYTFLKAARDATGRTKMWKNQSYEKWKKKEDVIGIVYLCFLMTIHAKASLRILLKKKNITIANDIVDVVWWQCFRFLFEVIPEADYLYGWIKQRKTECLKIEAKYGYEYSSDVAAVAVHQDLHITVAISTKE